MQSMRITWQFQLDYTFIGFSLFKFITVNKNLNFKRRKARQKFIVLKIIEINNLNSLCWK